jgi:hypothetical protein
MACVFDQPLWRRSPQSGRPGCDVPEIAVTIHSLLTTSAARWSRVIDLHGYVLDQPDRVMLGLSRRVLRGTR